MLALLSKAREPGTWHLAPSLGAAWKGVVTGERKRHTQYSLVYHAPTRTNQKSEIFSFFCFPGVPGCNIRKQLGRLLLHTKIELLYDCNSSIFPNLFIMLRSGCKKTHHHHHHPGSTLCWRCSLSSYSIRETLYGASPSLPSQGAMLNFSTPAGHALGLPRSPTCYGSRL